MSPLTLALSFTTVSLFSAGAALKVASLSTITTDIAENVGGAQIGLTAVVRPGVDPHEFHPTPGDLRNLAAADLVLITGKHIEGYLTKLENSIGGRSKFVDAGKSISSNLTLEEDGQKMEDPHWWHSIANVRTATEMIRDAFIKADPSNQARYDANTKNYLATLDDLQKWARGKVAELPRDKRKLVTSHDAFQYLARDYEFTVYAVEGISTDDEPSSKKVAALIQLIKEQRVKSVFAENIENPKVLSEITRETGAKLGGELYADGLGDEKARTYVEMMRHNLTTIVDGLK